MRKRRVRDPPLGGVRHHVVERRPRGAQLCAGQDQHRDRHERGSIDRLVQVFGAIDTGEGLGIGQEAVFGHERVLGHDRVAAGPLHAGDEPRVLDAHLAHRHQRQPEVGELAGGPFM